MSRPTLRARARERGTLVDVLSPGVGFWSEAMSPGSLVAVGGVIGSLDVLGQHWEVVSPRGGIARVEDARPAPARRPVDHGAVLVTLDLAAAVSGGPSEDGPGASAAGDLAFLSPSSGRFYSRPAPDKPAFVAVGDELLVGQTICLLEVMKTFNRIVFSGDGMPERVRVTSIGPEDGDDLEAGELILKLASIS